MVGVAQYLPCGTAGVLQEWVRRHLHQGRGAAVESLHCVWDRRPFPLEEVGTARLRSLPLRYESGWDRMGRSEGGGDSPEAVEAGLKDTFDMPWRESGTKVCIHIADAPCGARAGWGGLKRLGQQALNVRPLPITAKQSSSPARA